MARSMPAPALRPFLPEDTPILAAIFAASVDELAADDYTDAQREAWIAALDDEEMLADRLTGQLTLVGTLDGAPVGFVSLKGGEHIDLLYVHPAATGHGVGSVLCEAVEKLAGARGAKRLTVDASDNARDFFLSRGFSAERRNMVPVGDEWLGNTSMQKALNPAPSSPST